MNKLLVTLIAGAFASIAAAAPTTAERQFYVQSTTQAGSGSSASTQKTAAQQKANVGASKGVSKMTAVEKVALFAELTKSNINPDNPSGATGTSAQQMMNVAESKHDPKANAGLRTKAGQRELAQQLESKANK